MTEPLYYTDAMMQTCSARITALTDVSGSSAICLDRTCFYPEGGGQPGDRGTIADCVVVDTIKGRDGSILHKLKEPPPHDLGVGSPVDCVLDWRHRYEYMQQHTGQHVLSGALYRVAAADTVSVHQGTEVVTIEIGLATITDSLLRDVEEEANRVIREDLAVRAFLIQDHELSRYVLRRPTTRSGSIRLVEITGYDLVACGGVHLPRTGLINLVKAVGIETIRGQLRLAFKIGDRALLDYHEKHRAITESSDLFSCRPGQVPDRIRSAQEEIQRLHRTVRLRAERLAEHLMPEELGRDAPDSLMLEEEDEDLFKALTERAAMDPDRRVLLLNRKSDSLQWALVVGTGHPFPQQELRERVLSPVGAKGGGKPPLWRGIIPVSRVGQAESIEKFVSAFRSVWEEDRIRR